MGSYVVDAGKHVLAIMALMSALFSDAFCGLFLNPVMQTRLSVVEATSIRREHARDGRI